MRPPILLILLLLPLLALGQTKTVTKTISTNALTESFLVPSGASITISPGASLINQGTVSGFDAAVTVPWANVTSKPTTLSGFGITDGITSAAVAAGYQPRDTDLIDIAALSTTIFGRGLLTQADAAATRTTLGLGTLATQNGTISDYLTTAAAATTYQLRDTDLIDIAALSTTTFGRNLLTQADASATRTTLGLGTLATQNGTISDYLTTAAAIAGYQPLDFDLTSIAQSVTALYGRGLLTRIDASSARTYLGLGTLATQSGTISDYLTTATAAATYQPRDTDLIDIAALSTTTFGRSLLTQADASATRTTLGLGSLATQSGTLTDYLTTSSASSTYVALSGSYSNPSWITGLAWSKITGAPTFLASNGDGGSLTNLDPYALQQRSASNGQVLAWSTANSRWQPTTVGGSGTVTSVGLTGGNGVTVTGTSPITSSGSWTLGVNATDLKSHLSLSNVENVAVSTWAGSTNLTTLGTVTTGVWQGTNLDWTRVSKTGSSLADLATRSAGDLTSGTLDAARLPAPTTTTLGGVKRNTGTSGQFVNGIDSTGSLTYSTPAGGADVRLYTANDTWTNPSPSTPKRVFVRLVGGGGGGGSGRKGAAGATRCGGGGGGGAAVVEFWTLTTELSGTESVVVGAGGTGGASQTTNTTNGNPGVAGGDTTFAGTTAIGGNSGTGGTATAGTAGAATTNASIIGVGVAATAAGGAAGASGVAGVAAATVIFHAPTGGGGGGGHDAANVVRAGGNGGSMGSAGSITLISGGTGGASGGGNGSAGNGVRGSGTGGGGGGSGGGNGGNGGGFGSGGGGGAAGTDSVTNSGKGGDGAPGYVLIITYS